MTAISINMFAEFKTKQLMRKFYFEVFDFTREDTM